MRLTFIILFFFSIFNGFSQTTDTIMNLYLKSLDKEISHDTIYSCYTKIIQQDSLFYKIYYLRGYYSLLCCEKSIDSNGVLQINLDSPMFKNGIKDLKKCIQLYETNPKSFPNDCVFEKKYLPPKTVRLGELFLIYPCQNIINGVRIIISRKNHKKAKKMACKYWESTLDNVTKKILQEEFCY